jgi:hypothetical protein
MTLNRTGKNRLVLLTKTWAIKVPRLSSFLYGWHNNKIESFISRQDPRHRCPVILSLFGSLLIVMPKLVPLSESEWKSNMESLHLRWQEQGRKYAPEPKRDSFGRCPYSNRILAIDYGYEGGE